jgi:hypothetical protein
MGGEESGAGVYHFPIKGLVEGYGCPSNGDMVVKRTPLRGNASHCPSTPLRNREAEVLATTKFKVGTFSNTLV